jgi:hypothetical protein
MYSRKNHIYLNSGPPIKNEKALRFTAVVGSIILTLLCLSSRDVKASEICYVKWLGIDKIYSRKVACLVPPALAKAVVIKERLIILFPIINKQTTRGLDLEVLVEVTIKQKISLETFRRLEENPMLFLRKTLEKQLGTLIESFYSREPEEAAFKKLDVLIESLLMSIQQENQVFKDVIVRNIQIKRKVFKQPLKNRNIF